MANKPEVVAWLRNERGENARGAATFAPMCVFGNPEPHGLVASYSPVVLLSDYEALQAECEELRKDAERYRWLADTCVSDWLGEDGPVLPVLVYGKPWNANWRAELDAAIDAAMQEPSHGQ